MAFEASPRISVLLGRLTATRAGYLDELAAANIPSDIDGLIADIGVFPTANYATLAAYVEDIRTRLIAIVADTGELQTDWVDGGRLDLLIDAIKAKTDTIVWGDITTIDTEIGVIDGIVDNILADTATIVWGDITTIDGLIDAIILDIGVFPTANYASLAIYVEDIRTRLTTIDTEVGVIDGIVDDILADTATINWANITTIDSEVGVIDGIVDDILLDTAELADGTHGLPALNSDLDTLLTRLSAARAGYLDNLIGAETAGTYNLPDGVVEQDAVEITPAELIQYFKLCLDLNALTQTAYLRTYVKVDGANYRQIDYAEYPADFPTDTEGIVMLLVPSSKDIKVTMQSAIAEGAIRAVPYFFVRRSAA